jgi:cytoskeletal protein CcmA (bactofilin family)
MHRRVVWLLALAVSLALLPGIAAAETRSGGSVTVAPGETVDGDLTVYGGNVVIDGTVTGDLTVYGGTVIVGGTVGGATEVNAGSLRVGGTMEGPVTASAGSVEVTPSGMVAALDASAGSVTIAGTVENDARLAAEEVRLTETALVGGDLVYSGSLQSDEAAVVQGAVTQDTTLGGGPGPALPPGIPTLYGVVVSLLAGGILLLVFPRYSDDVADQIRTEPLRTGLAGLLAAIGVPLVLLVVALTVVGLPIALALFPLSLVLAWVGTLYGRYVLGVWLLARIDREHRWLALTVGVVAIAGVRLVPIAGELIHALVSALGFGALVLVAWRRYRNPREPEVEAPTAPAAPASEDAAA